MPNSHSKPDNPPNHNASGTHADTEPLPQTLIQGQTPDQWTGDGSAAENVPHDFGRYLIERELGRGGMGTVYLAHDRQLDRKVAIKIPLFRQSGDLSTVERFYREARAMATVQHSNLCPVYDVGQFGRWHYLTMAFIDGHPLSARLRSEPAMPSIRAAELLRKVAMALHKAHLAGIVHRDLKPANIMITNENEPIIMDFGLARRESTGEVELTDSQAVFGTPAYMAPEQVEARHDDVGPATDVYALGVILYQMVTGKRPFEGTAASIFGQIVTSVPAAPSKRCSAVPAAIDAICLKAMQKWPSQRHASSAEFAAELDQFLTSPELSVTATYQVRLDEVVGSKPFAQSFVDPSSVSRQRREAELRQVTVAVFNYDSDVSGGSLDGSTTNSEQLRERTESFATFVRERVARFGGTLVSGLGQELIACYGFPVAFEDAAQRAVRAGLQVLRDLGAVATGSVLLPSVEQCWVSVHSGEAIAEEVGGEAGISLVGEARNTAVRIDSVAEAGSLLISAATQQRVRLLFELESLGVRRIRGVAQPVELFKVLKEAASRNRVELVDPGNLTPLIGRDTELSILKGRWEQALEELGQIVLLIGEAGLGKSRLIRELREHVTRESDDDVAIIELRCSQYHLNTGFFPVVEVISRLLAFEGQLPAARLETVVRYLSELKLDSAENVALFCGMLSVPTDQRFPPLALSPQKLKERTDELLLNWLKQLVQTRPVLFIVEDLHWVDPSTLELLERHVAQFESGRVLSLLTFRPEFETPWKSKPHQTQIALNRLSKRQIAELMRKRSGRTDIPDVIVNQVVERTDGVPLFIEEFTSLIVESGLLDRPSTDGGTTALMRVIPATLHDLLLARLDRMASNRDVIQLAATIGREFSFELLAASSTISESELLIELAKLVKAEILFQKGQGAAAQFIFKHALLQDAAYRSMLTRKRQLVHHHIAEVLESRFSEVVATQPALVAQHFTEAGTLDKATEYWLKAGQLSQDRSNTLEAIQQFERGLSLSMSLPPSPQRDMLELGFKLPLSAVLMGVKGYAAPEVEPVQNRCIEICRQLGEGAPLFPLLIANWEWLFIRGRFTDCDRRCREVISLAEAAQGPGMMSEAHWTQVCTSFYTGDFPAARDHALIGWQHYHREASIEYMKITQQNCGPLLVVHHAMALWKMGFPDQAIARAHEGLDLAINLKHPFTQAVIDWKVAQVYDFSRMGEKAIEHAERSHKIAAEQGFAYWVAMALGVQGIGCRQIGRDDEAIELLRECIAMLQATGANILFGKFTGHLAEALWQRSRRDEAWKMLDEAFGHMQSGERYLEAELLRWRGDFHFDSGAFDKAEAAYRHSLAVAMRQQAMSYELRTTMRLCRIWKQRGQDAEAKSALTAILDRFTEGFETPDLIEAKQRLTEWA